MKHEVRGPKFKGRNLMAEVLRKGDTPAEVIAVLIRKGDTPAEVIVVLWDRNVPNKGMSSTKYEF